MIFYDTLPELCEQNEIKFRKAIRAGENFVWNVRLVQGQSDLISKLRQDALDYIKSAKEAGQATGILVNADKPRASPVVNDPDTMHNMLSQNL